MFALQKDSEDNPITQIIPTKPPNLPIQKVFVKNENDNHNSTNYKVQPKAFYPYLI